MNDQMNERTQFSPYAGRLCLETVAGEANKTVEYENDAAAANGDARTMYVYAPRSGCPDPKQCQVMMVLRSGRDEASAAEEMERLGLQALAEEEHFLLLFPNPTDSGWNYREDPAMDNDGEFLGRCFASLRSGKVGIGGFNGMIYYIACCPEASALMMNMAVRQPIRVSAMMIGSFPEGYQIPADGAGAEVAACVCENPAAVEYLQAANGCSGRDGDVELGRNPNVRLLALAHPIDALSVLYAWHKVLCRSRRWQNDTFGTYQPRTAFTERGFTAHVKDASLGCNDNFPHTWYEYVPPKLRGSKEKVPLVFYFHGVNCVPLYGAEQSNWHEIADREGLIVVYPAPAVAKAWNIFNDPSMPSDFAFVLALIAHMKRVHPIDEARIYATGFSMGGMMTHAITQAYPQVFAAAAPCNAFDFAYFKTPRAVYSGLVKGVDKGALADISQLHLQADEARNAQDYRMPLFQNAGYNDATIALWPVDESTDDVRIKTIAHWKEINHIANPELLDSDTLTGLAADESFYEDPECRFYHQRWRSDDPGNPVLFELLVAKRMPHAIVPIQIEYAWHFLKRFRRLENGSLSIDA